MALLTIENLFAWYGMAESLHGVSLSLEEGGIAGVIGPNGAGKSTLMDSIMGLVTVKGSIRLGGREIIGLKPAELVRAGIGYAPERAHLFPYMSVRDNLLVGAYTARGDIEKNLELVHGLFPVLAERWAQETATQSGGERQMVSLGRALMTSPRILLVDEPTIGLAPKICAGIAEALLRLNRETGLAILIAEQNVNFAMQLARH
ncbi:MAG TPA: ABC transporter ATP-binding protein, partial [Rhizobiaceae bacterium]|nr:ABC transporter ATP-binding protein [Rhizobiaceae bacterium]